MLVMKYERLGAAAYLSHLDVLRLVIRTLKRARIPVKYSQGFNPHMLLYFAPPVPIGLKSQCEYCTVDTELAPAEFLERYNRAAAEGCKALDAYTVDKNPNLANLAKCAEYEITIEGLGAHGQAVEDIMNSAQYVIEYTAKGKTVSEDVRAKIISLKQNGDTLTAVLACGNVNLRADRLGMHLARQLDLNSDIDIIKKKLYNDLDKINFT